MRFTDLDAYCVLCSTYFAQVVDRVEDGVDDLSYLQDAKRAHISIMYNASTGNTAMVRFSMLHHPFQWIWGVKHKGRLGVSLKRAMLSEALW